MSVRKINNGLNVICKNLQKYRKLQGLSQEELASNMNLLGIPTIKNDISAIENNKRTARDYEVLGFVEVLNITFEDLFTDVKTMLEKSS